MSEQEAVELALRTVAADLEGMIRVRADIYAQVDDDADGQYVHAWIRTAVEFLQDRLRTFADDRGIDLAGNQ